MKFRQLHNQHHPTFHFSSTLSSLHSVEALPSCLVPLEPMRRMQGACQGGPTPRSRRGRYPSNRSKIQSECLHPTHDSGSLPKWHPAPPESPPPPDSLHSACTLSLTRTRWSSTLGTSNTRSQAPSKAGYSLPLPLLLRS